MRIDKISPTQTTPQAAWLAGNQSPAPNWRGALQKMVIGSSPLLNRCLKLAGEAAATQKNVVILGETGAGKDLFAHYIHTRAATPQGQFTVVDCRSATEVSFETVLTSDPELRENQPGNYPPHRGTLYLDEINELSAHNQETIFSLLLNSGFKSRVIAASQQDLDRLAKQGRFRTDLLPLLQNYRIDLPPLRERPEDILEISRFFLNRLCLWNGLAVKTVTPEFNAMLLRYPWPGNVRELINTLEQSLLASEDCQTLFPKHLPSHIRIHVTKYYLQQKAYS